MAGITIEVPEKNCIGCKFLKKVCVDIYTCTLFDSVLEHYPNKCVSCGAASKKVLLENK